MKRKRRHQLINPGQMNLVRNIMAFKGRSPGDLAVVKVMIIKLLRDHNKLTTESCKHILNAMMEDLGSFMFFKEAFCSTLDDRHERGNLRRQLLIASPCTRASNKRGLLSRSLAWPKDHSQHVPKVVVIDSPIKARTMITRPTTQASIYKSFGIAA